MEICFSFRKSTLVIYFLEIIIDVEGPIPNKIKVKKIVTKELGIYISLKIILKKSVNYFHFRHFLFSYF